MVFIDIISEMDRIEIDNWILDIEEEDGGVVVQRAAARSAAAGLPDALLGRPVVALADHAFKAEENKALQELQLPASLRVIGDYAFYGCSSLRTLRLYDNVSGFGGGVFTSCRELTRFVLTRTFERHGPALSAILSELSRELDITLEEVDGRVGRLIFPEYEEETTEISGGQMVFFAYSIEGAGYTYHHCLKDRVFSYRAYDDLWPDYMGRGYSAATAVKQACYRLAWPVELSAASEALYLRYLQKNGTAALEWLASVRDTDLPLKVIGRAGFSKEALAAGAAKARELHRSEVLALILEEQHRRFPPSRAKNYDL